MNVGGDIADRHFLPASGLDDATRSETLSVRVIISDKWVTSIAGQLLTSSLVNLLCRQIRLISRIEIISINATALIPLPGIANPDPFPACMEQLAQWAVNGAVAVSTRATDADVDYTVLIGAECAARTRSSGAELFVIGDGWRAWAGESRLAPKAELPRSTNPLGPFFAATLVAGEIFKRSRGILRGRYLASEGFSLWSGRSSEQWEGLDDGPEIAGRSVAPIHIAGVGAVGNGLAYVISNARFAKAYLVTIDDDAYDDTNLNRCTLAGWEDRGEEKVNAVVRALRAANVEAFPFFGTIKSYVADAKVGLRPDVAVKLDQLDFDIVVSCVDKGVSRQDVQGLRPKLLLGGSTLDLQAKTNAYGLWPGAACLACYNSAESDHDKVRVFEAMLRKMSVDQRREYLLERRLNADAIEEHLTRATCGSLGEAALKDFATRTTPEFSVGFVSLGAAVLLGAALFRHTLFGQSAPKRLDMTTFNFLNGKLLDSGFGADAQCQLRCSEGG